MFVLLSLSNAVSEDDIKIGKQKREKTKNIEFFFYFLG